MNTDTSRNPEWRKRLVGLVPEGLTDKTVLVVGCGSVGSFIIEELARSGISNFIIVDPDIVEWSNLTRTNYVSNDVGKPKVDCIKNKLKSIFEDINVQVFNSVIQEVDLENIMKQSNLVVSAVDDPAATNMINRFAYALDKILICVGLFKGAKGGEVIVVDSQNTPCYQCSTGGVRKMLSGTTIDSVNRDRDYGTSKLVAEVALGSDIHFVCCAAIKIILSVLSQDFDVPLAQFTKVLLDNGTNYLILGMEPEYYLFPSTHKDAIGQYAFQSIWANTKSNTECYICGDAEFREPI